MLRMSLVFGVFIGIRGYYICYSMYQYPLFIAGFFALWYWFPAVWSRLGGSVESTKIQPKGHFGII